MHMAKEIQSITFNWFFTPDGENYDRRTVGVDDVVRIEKYDSYYDGPPAHFTVFYQDGRMLDIHNPNTVAWIEVPEVTPTSQPITDLPF